MSLVHGIIEGFGFPWVSRVLRFCISQYFYPVARACPWIVSPPMERDHYQIEFPLRILHPSHSMDGRFVRQFDRLPFLFSVRWGNQIKDGATVHCVSRV